MILTHEPPKHCLSLFIALGIVRKGKELLWVAVSHLDDIDRMEFDSHKLNLSVGYGDMGWDTITCRTSLFRYLFSLFLGGIVAPSLDGLDFNPIVIYDVSLHIIILSHLIQKSNFIFEIDKHLIVLYMYGIA